MGYRMDYGGAVQKPVGGVVIHRRRRRIYLLILAALCAVGVIYRIYFSFHEEISVTAAALEGLTENVKEGMDIPEALGSFWREMFGNEG